MKKQKDIGKSGDDGLQVGDIIISINGKLVANMTDHELGSNLDKTNCKVVLGITRAKKS